MPSKRKLGRGRLALVAVVGFVGLIGNMRNSVSHGVPDQEATITGPVGWHTQVASSGEERQRLERIAADRAARAGGVDGGQGVPAIYAWDPDVRFVYYRHVSKWM